MIGCIIFRLVMANMQNSIGFGPETEKQIDVFCEEYMDVFYNETTH
jgi:hypothetical protein